MLSTWGNCRLQLHSDLNGKTPSCVSLDMPRNASMKAEQSLAPLLAAGDRLLFEPFSGGHANVHGSLGQGVFRAVPVTCRECRDVPRQQSRSRSMGCPQAPARKFRVACCLAAWLLGCLLGGCLRSATDRRLKNGAGLLLRASCLRWSRLLSKLSTETSHGYSSEDGLPVTRNADRDGHIC